MSDDLISRGALLEELESFRSTEPIMRIVEEQPTAYRDSAKIVKSGGVQNGN